MTQATGLEGLRQTLRQLRGHTIPQKTKVALEDALASLDLLLLKLAENEEQRRLAALYRVSQLLGSSLQLEEVLDQVMAAAIQLTGAERAILMLHDADTGELEVQAARNFERGELESYGLGLSRTVIQQTINSGQGLLTTNAQADPRFAGSESVITFALRSILCAPLTSRARTVGAIYLDNRAQDALFTQDDLDLLNAFASQAAIAIENARLYTQTDQSLARRVGELETLTRLDRELNARLDVDLVMEIALRWAIEQTAAVDGWAALVDPESGMLAVQAGAQKGSQLPPDEPLIARALKEGSLQVSLPTKSDLAVTIVPIMRLGHPLGLIRVEHPESPDEARLEFLSRLAARAAGAIENAQLFQAVQEANLAKSRFVSVVSHELRMPMTSIKGYADLILQGRTGAITDLQREFLGIVSGNVERMRLLVQDLSDISRGETGQLHLRPAKIVLADLIDQVLGTLRPKIEEKRQALVLDLPDGLPQAFADPNRVTQVLTNLISNAWKYTPIGGRIRLGLAQAGEYVQVEVEDSGIGISADDQTRLFDQFFRSEDPAVREEQGWGLGLNVTKMLVDRMGGEIGVSSRLGAGSTFWFRLPAAAEVK